MEKKYLFLSRLTIVFVFLVIIAGSVVRMSGSGMGCPDWPKCFGEIIPPTDSSQLPENYREIYSSKREKEIQKFADLLDMVGASSVAEKIRNDKSLLDEGPFNASKTWTEYVNRLVGFLAGNLMLAQFILSFWFFRRNRRIFYISLLNLILIGITAWFGSIVVATNLLPWLITLHMGLALLIVLVQVYHIYLAEQPKFKHEVSLTFLWMLRFGFILMIVQIIMGTQVRQQIDEIASLYGEEQRALWVSHLDPLFLIHRSFSIAVILIHAWLFYSNFRRPMGVNQVNLLFFLILFVALAGVSLAYLGMPRLAQPIHLLLSAIILALQYNVLLRVKRERKYLP
jgi:heme a synthase